MEDIFKLILNTESYKKFYAIAREYVFQREDGIFINPTRLSKDTPYGLNKNGYLLIILPVISNLSGFKIKELFILKDKTKFHDENKDINISGLPFIYKSTDANDQYELLSVIETFLEKNDYIVHLNQFFEILQKANSFSDKFSSSSFFAEASTILRLLKIVPTIADNWASSAKSIIDISGSIDQNPAIEVKSTKNQAARIHKLSIHQIRYFQTHENTILASVIIFEEEQGISCKDICEIILSKLEINSSGYKFIKSVIVSYINKKEFTEEFYDKNRTINSIRFYSPTFDEIPLNNPPVWLMGGTLQVDAEVLPKSDFGS